MLPLHFVDLPQAFNALQASGVGGRVQMATFHFVAGDQPNMYPAWDIKTLGGRQVGPLFVLADSGKGGQSRRSSPARHTRRPGRLA
jgi:hypothetical protein